MILWAGNLCWAQLYGFSGLSWTWFPVKQYEMSSRIHEAKTYNSFPFTVGLQTGQIGFIKNDWSLHHRGDSNKRKVCSREIFWPSSSLLEHFSLHPQFLILGFFIAFMEDSFDFLYAGLCDFSPLHLSFSPLHLFPHIYSHSPKSLLNPTLALGLSLPSPFPSFPSPKILLHASCPLCYLLSKRPWNCFERWLWCLCEVHLHEREVERKTRQKESVLTVSSYFWKSLENFQRLSPYWGSGKTTVSLSLLSF